MAAVVVSGAVDSASVVSGAAVACAFISVAGVLLNSVDVFIA